MVKWRRGASCQIEHENCTSGGTTQCVGQDASSPTSALGCSVQRRVKLRFKTAPPRASAAMAVASKRSAHPTRPTDCAIDRYSWRGPTPVVNVACVAVRTESAQSAGNDVDGLLTQRDSCRRADGRMCLVTPWPRRELAVEGSRGTVASMTFKKQ